MSYVKRPNRTVQRPVRVAPTKPTWWARIGRAWPIAFAVGTVVGAMMMYGADALRNSAKLPEAMRETYSGLRDWYMTDAQLSAVWTNSTEYILGMGEGPTPDNTIHIRLSVYGSDVSGEIAGGNLKKIVPFDLVLIEGKKQRGGIEAMAYDYIGGQKTRLASFRLRQLDDGELQFETTNQPGRIFPPQVRLFKAPYQDDVSGEPALTKTPDGRRAAPVASAASRTARRPVSKLKSTWAPQLLPPAK